MLKDEQARRGKQLGAVEDNYDRMAAKSIKRIHGELAYERPVRKQLSPTLRSPHRAAACFTPGSEAAYCFLFPPS
jgi:hypothetical protein